MKKFLVPLMSLLLISSCSKDADFNAPQKSGGVSFATSITRVANNQFEDTEQIAVLAYTDAEFTQPHSTPMLGYQYSEEMGIFTSENPYSYTSAAPSLAFRAIYPYDANVNASDAFAFEMNPNQTEHEDYTYNDLLVAQTDLTDSEIAKLTFSHKMSAINIEVIESDVDLSRAVVMMYGKMAVDCDIAADTYTATGEVETIRTQECEDGTYRAIIAPQTMKKGETLIKFMYLGDNDEEYELVLDDDIVFRSGYRRTLEVEIVGGKLTFQSTIDDWTYDGFDEDGPTVAEPMLRHFSEHRYPKTENTWVIYDETAEPDDFLGLLDALTTVGEEEPERQITLKFPCLTNLPSYAIYGYLPAVVEVDLPEVVELGEAAIAHCESLTTVSMPKVETTGYGVFYSCKALKTLTIATESTLTLFGDYVEQWLDTTESLTFADVDLSQIDLITSDSYVDTYVFFSCPAGRYETGGTADEPTYEYQGETMPYKFGPFKTINGAGVPDAPSADDLMLADLSLYIYPKSGDGDVWTINDATATAEDFEGLLAAINDINDNDSSRSIELVFPNLESVPAEVFKNSLHSDDEINLSVIEAMTFSKAKSFGDNAFEDCRFTSFSAPMVETIGDHAFYDVTSLTELSMPAVKEIAAHAFGMCTGLENVTLENLETMGNNAFANCRGMESFSAPKLTVAGNESLYGCDELTTVSMPALVDGGYAILSGDSKLKTLTIATAGEIVKFGDLTNGGCTFKDIDTENVDLTISADYIVDEVYFECEVGNYSYDSSVWSFVFDGTTTTHKYGPFKSITAAADDSAAALMLADISADNIPEGDVWYIYDESGSEADFAGLKDALDNSTDITLVFPNLTTLEANTLDYVTKMVALYIPEATRVDTEALFYNSLSTLYAPKATEFAPDSMGATYIEDFTFGIYDEVTEFGEEYDDPFDYDSTYMFYPSTMSITTGTVNQKFENEYGYISLDFSSIGGMTDFYDTTYEELAGLTFVDAADFVEPDVVINAPQN